MRIAVAGGTGVAGRYVVLAAEEAGHEVVSLSRSGGVDVRTGDGLTGALDGVDVVVDALNTGTRNRAKATAFFVETTRNLQSAASATGVRHLVLLSIVGVDRVPGFPYYEAKVAQEVAVQQGPVAVSIVRATQFHEFAGQLLDGLAKGPFAPIPSMRIRPVAARTVGRRLVEVAVAGSDSGSGGTHSDLAGPDEIALTDMARLTVRRRGNHLLVVPVRLPGAAGRALRGGALLPGPAAVVAGPGPHEWLDSADVR